MSRVRKQNPHLETALDEIEGFELLDFQFLLCEMGKFLKFLRSGSKIYHRKFWRDYGCQSAGQPDINNSEADEQSQEDVDELDFADPRGD